MGVIQSTLNQGIGVAGALYSQSALAETRKDIKKEKRVHEAEGRQLQAEEAALRAQHEQIVKAPEDMAGLKLRQESAKEIKDLRYRQFKHSPTQQTAENLFKAGQGVYDIDTAMDILNDTANKKALALLRQMGNVKNHTNFGE